MIQVGDTAPAFDLPGTDGDEVERYRLSDFTESGAAVVLFYPFDFSPVCTEELCNFRDSEMLTFTADLDVVAISADSVYAHRKFVRENDLPIPLLSDHDGRVSEAYGVLYDELEGHPTVSKRAVFVVDSEEAVRYAWVADEWTTDPDITAVYECVRDLECIEIPSGPF
ncbi:hypothetical protein BRD00_06760 [Halobacteriales archaeon QS_8_69_26]|nr:MAG: hypothetical protein BRD00_06760 [Halobacteriales archaeon QS_8_69_26]